LAIRTTYPVAGETVIAIGAFGDNGETVRNPGLMMAHITGKTTGYDEYSSLQEIFTTINTLTPAVVPGMP
jgi:hypothetical protein